MAEQLANFARSTLVDPLDDSATSVEIADATGWPTADAYIVCELEIMRLTSRASNVLTVVRGQEGSTAVAHAAGETIGAAITVSGLTVFIQENGNPALDVFAFNTFK